MTLATSDSKIDFLRQHKQLVSTTRAWGAPLRVAWYRCSTGACMAHCIAAPKTRVPYGPCPTGLVKTCATHARLQTLLGVSGDQGCGAFLVLTIKAWTCCKQAQRPAVSSWYLLHSPCRLLMFRIRTTLFIAWHQPQSSWCS